MTDRILAPGPRLDPIASPTGEPVPVTLLTGFLGAGKTTLLNRILNGDHGLRVGVLVNDFGSVNIDAELISSVGENTISLSNGCVCCEVRDDLIESLESLLGADRSVEYVILEASGVADPEGIVMTFLDARYEDLLRLDSITCIVDAEGLFRDRDDEALAMLKLRQLGFADLVILNKVDRVDDDHIEIIRSWIDSHFNRVRIIEAVHCDVPLEILLSAGRFDSGDALHRVAGSGHSADTARFDAWVYRSSEPLRTDDLREVIRTLPPEVYRCKGFVHLAEHPEQRTVLQGVGRRMTLEPLEDWGARTPQTELVFIGTAGAIDGTHLSSALDDCRESPARRA